MRKTTASFGNDGSLSVRARQDFIDRSQRVRLNDRCSVPYVIQVTERVSPCPSLDYYDHAVDSRGRYEGKWGRWHTDDDTRTRSFYGRYSLKEILE